MRFGNFQSDHKLLCRISWKVLAKNLRRIKKNYALRNPLIWCQMSKCAEWVIFRLIWVIFVGFRYDNTRFEIFDFWLRPQSAVWELLKSFCKKSETNQKKLCSEKSTHLMSNVKMSRMGEFPSDLGHFVVFSAWLYTFWDFGVLSQLRSNVEMSEIDRLSSILSHFVMFSAWLYTFCDFWVLSHMRSNVEMSKFGILSSKFTHFSWHFVMTMHVLSFWIFESNHNLLCGISRKVLPNHLRRIKKIMLGDIHSSEVKIEMFKIGVLYKYIYGILTF